jgi:hypothetical protein
VQTLVLSLQLKAKDPSFLKPIFSTFYAHLPLGGSATKDQQEEKPCAGQEDGIGKEGFCQGYMTASSFDLFFPEAPVEWQGTESDMGHLVPGSALSTLHTDAPSSRPPE